MIRRHTTTDEGGGQWMSAAAWFNTTVTVAAITWGATVISAVWAGSSAYTSVVSRVSQLERETVELKRRSENRDNQIALINQSLAAIGQDVQWIRERLAKTP